jgi:hypothetical protein
MEITIPSSERNSETQRGQATCLRPCNAIEVSGFKVNPVVDTVGGLCLDLLRFPYGLCVIITQLHLEPLLGAQRAGGLGSHCF